MVGETPDHIENAYAWMLAQQIQHASGERITVQIDLVFSDHLKTRREMFYAGEVHQEENARLADLLSPLVIEADGAVVPLQYGFPRAYALGNLANARLSSMAETWRRNSRPAFHALCRAAYEQATSTATPRFISWYDTLAKLGHSLPGSAVDHSIPVPTQRPLSFVQMNNR